MCSNDSKSLGKKGVGLPELHILLLVDGKRLDCVATSVTYPLSHFGGSFDQRAIPTPRRNARKHGRARESLMEPSVWNQRNSVGYAEFPM